MLDDLSSWLRLVHIFAFAAWMAAMWYLPRRMIYHTGTEPGSVTSETFKIMERRLLRAIATPAMIGTWIMGLWLATEMGYWTSGWLHTKLLFVLALSACHGVISAHVRRFANDERPKPERWYRILNEVPTVLFIAILVFVVFKPF